MMPDAQVEASGEVGSADTLLAEKVGMEETP